MRCCPSCGAVIEEHTPPPPYDEATAVIEGAPVDLDPERTPPAGEAYQAQVDQSAEDPA